VEVVLRPKIDVYPASTTLVKNQVIKDLEYILGKEFFLVLFDPKE
jgi:hypothetical protein